MERPVLVPGNQPTEEAVTLLWRRVPPNNRVNLPARPVTRVACATRAPVRPAGYAER
jgi:hypothetical protein